MLVIASLNLPSTAVFEFNDEEANPESDEIAKPVSINAPSLFHADTEDAEASNDLPFDADPDEAKQKPGIPSSKAKAPKPQKSIVDERAPAEKMQNLRPATSESKPNIAQTMEAPSNWNPAKEVEALKRQCSASSFLKTLSKVSAEDEDVKLEKRRLECERNAQPQSGLRAAYKRTSSNASLVSVDDSDTTFLNIPFSVEPLHAANQGLINALNSAVAHGVTDGYKSVGLLGFGTDNLPEGTKRRITSRLIKEADCYPAYVSDTAREGHYEGYCKEFLWPTFHCQIPDVPTSKAYEEHSWGDYVDVNQAIADKVVEAYEPGDFIWVHDYHLMLVPQMVRAKLPHAPIGFFMHVAFPSSEVFRCLAYRAELLSGILAANSVGFHVPVYVQHFKMCVARLLAVDITGPGVIEEAEHDTFVTSVPLGIDTERLDRILDVDNVDSKVQQHRRIIRNRWPYQKIIAARDKLDPIRGLQAKLRAFDQFLSENPHWASKVVLVQICSSARSSLDESVLETIADQINSKYGDLASGVQPVVLLTENIRYEQFLALLSEADGFCVSCLRDGMNLTCHEYAYCNSSVRMGPLILSEFTGSASVLGSHSLLINPWDRDQMAQAFKACVEMPRWEKETRWKGLRDIVINRPAVLWAEELTYHISEAWEDEISRECVKPDFTALEKLYHSIQEDEKRVFFLEVEQPVTETSHDILNQEPGQKIVRSYERRRSQPAPDLKSQHNYYYASRIPVDIRELCNDPKNVVYIISADSKESMEWMYRAVPGLGLIAEFGKFVRKCGDTHWSELQMEDNHWKEEVVPWLKLMEERSLTQDITVHESSIIVVFNDSMISNNEQRDLSMLGEYVALLNDHYARELGIRTKLEENVLTVYRSNLGIQRKNAFDHLMKEVGGKVGFTLIANQPFATEADDVIYEWAESLKNSHRTRELVTMVVGKHQSRAQTMVEGTNALLNLLHSMRTKDRVIRLR